MLLKKSDFQFSRGLFSSSWLCLLRQSFSCSPSSFVNACDTWMFFCPRSLFFWTLLEKARRTSWQGLPIGFLVSCDFSWTFSVASFHRLSGDSKPIVFITSFFSALVVMSFSSMLLDEILRDPLWAYTFCDVIIHLARLVLLSLRRVHISFWTSNNICITGINFFTCLLEVFFTILSTTGARFASMICSFFEISSFANFSLVFSKVR